MRQSAASAKTGTRLREARVQRRARRTRARAHFHKRSPHKLGQTYAQVMPNHVQCVVRAVFGLGEEMAHCQADQIERELISKFLVRNFGTVFGEVLEGV